MPVCLAAIQTENPFFCNPKHVWTTFLRPSCERQRSAELTAEETARNPYLTLQILLNALSGSHPPSWTGTFRHPSETSLFHVGKLRTLFGFKTLGIPSSRRCLAQVLPGNLHIERATRLPAPPAATQRDPLRPREGWPFLSDGAAQLQRQAAFQKEVDENEVEQRLRVKGRLVGLSTSPLVTCPKLSLS